jgi:hypothetical protein
MAEPNDNCCLSWEKPCAALCDGCINEEDYFEEDGNLVPGDWTGSFAPFV